jgi:hypothetical protein
MPEEKKSVKASKAKAAKPGIEKTKKAPKGKARKTRGPRKARGRFADLLRKQAELEAIRKGAKAELKKHYDSLTKEAEKVRAQYKELFAESIESAPKARRTGAKKATGRIPGLKPYAIQEVKAFIEQKVQGRATIRIPGRKPKSIARMEDAYRHSENAEDILEILNT